MPHPRFTSEEIAQRGHLPYERARAGNPEAALYVMRTGFRTAYRLGGPEFFLDVMLLGAYREFERRAGELTTAPGFSRSQPACRCTTFLSGRSR